MTDFPNKGEPHQEKLVINNMFTVWQVLSKKTLYLMGIPVRIMRLRAIRLVQILKIVPQSDGSGPMRLRT